MEKPQNNYPKWPNSGQKHFKRVYTIFTCANFRKGQLVTGSSIAGFWQTYLRNRQIRHREFHSVKLWPFAGAVSHLLSERNRTILALWAARPALHLPGLLWGKPTPLQSLSWFSSLASAFISALLSLPGSSAFILPASAIGLWFFITTNQQRDTWYIS